jgi:hypothetical protein
MARWYLHNVSALSVYMEADPPRGISRNEPPNGVSSETDNFQKEGNRHTGVSWRPARRSASRKATAVPQVASRLV